MMRCSVPRTTACEGEDVLGRFLFYFAICGVILWGVDETGRDLLGCHADLM